MRQKMFLAEIVVFVVALITLGSFTFMTFVHNIDNAWNLKTLNAYYGDSWEDCTATRNCLDPDSIYVSGLAGSIGTFFIMVMFTFMAGVYTGLRERKEPTT